MLRQVTWAFSIAAALALVGCTPSRENGEGASSRSGGGGAQKAITSPEGVPRVTPEYAREKVQKGEALLVCAYDDSRFENFKLEGALSLSQLEETLKTRDRDTEIIFYCA